MGRSAYMRVRSKEDGQKCIQESEEQGMRVKSKEDGHKDDHKQQLRTQPV